MKKETGKRNSIFFKLQIDVYVLYFYVLNFSDSSALFLSVTHSF